jgi:alpha-tubulin suppressor-like RCC1 family protein
MMKPIDYLYLRWRSVVALLGGILVAMVMLLFAALGQSPAQAAASPPPQHIAAGYNHSLALHNGHLYSWGSNLYGQLGVNSDNDWYTPQLVHGPDNNQSGLSNVTYVDAGYHHNLAIKSDGTADGNPNDGTVYGWGSNAHGQLGDGTTNNNRLYPVQVHGGQQGEDPSGNNVLHNIVAVAAGYQHSLALASDGTVYAWGENAQGALGCHSNNDKDYPVQVHGPGNVGYLGDGTSTPPIVDVSAYTHSLAVASDGHVYAWGNGSDGQLGLHSDNDHSVPYQVHGLNNAQPPNGLSGIVDADAGYHHSLAVGSDGHVYAWGDNFYGQLGIGTSDIDEHYYPEKVSSPNEGFVTVAGGEFHSAGVTRDLSGNSAAWAWGLNSDGQLGHLASDEPNTTPWQVPAWGLGSVAAGANHNLAVGNYGSVLAWGDNSHGKLGDGTNTEPVENQLVEVEFPFSTPQEDTIKPYVKLDEVVPANAATDVRRKTNVIASFSEDMDAETINKDTFTLMKEDTTTIIAAKVSYNLATNEATLNPNKPLSKGETYTATVSTSAKDLVGNQLDQDHASSGDQPMEWSFTVKN